MTSADCEFESCEFESEVLAAVLQSRWPERIGDPLRAHVAACAVCSDVAAIASAVDEAREDLRASVMVPDSGRVWWLAQLRARREAAEAAGRPITVAQAAAFACAVGLVGACFGATSTWFQSALQSALRWIGSRVSGFDVKAFLVSTTTLLAEHGALVLAMAVVLFLVPTAVYFALGKD
jgi:hypothetical protein